MFIRKALAISTIISSTMSHRPKCLVACANPVCIRGAGNCAYGKYCKLTKDDPCCPTKSQCVPIPSFECPKTCNIMCRRGYVCEIPNRQPGEERICPKPLCVLARSPCSKKCDLKCGAGKVCMISERKAMDYICPKPRCVVKPCEGCKEAKCDYLSCSEDKECEISKPGALEVLKCKCPVVFCVAKPPCIALCPAVDCFCGVGQKCEIKKPEIWECRCPTVKCVVDDVDYN